MNLFQKFTKKNINQGILPNEKMVLHLLLNGDNEVLEKLRKQLAPELIVGVERSVRGSEYQLQFIKYFDNLNSHSLGKDINFRIDDLVIINKSDGRQIDFEISIYEGELAILSGVVLNGIFPMEFEVGDWFYKAIENDSVILKKERDLSNIPTTRDSKELDKLSDFQEWILSLKDQTYIDIQKQQLKLKLYSRIDMVGINHFETENSVSLPNDYKEFLVLSNGADFFGVNILSISDCFLIDIFLPQKFAAFHTWEDGNYTVFNIEEDFSVFYISHDPFGYGKIANSFEDWLRKVEAEIRNEGYLSHPIDQKPESIYGNVLKNLKIIK